MSVLTQHCNNLCWVPRERQSQDNQWYFIRACVFSQMKLFPVVTTSRLTMGSMKLYEENPRPYAKPPEIDPWHKVKRDLNREGIIYYQAWPMVDLLLSVVELMEDSLPYLKVIGEYCFRTEIEKTMTIWSSLEVSKSRRSSRQTGLASLRTQSNPFRISRQTIVPCMETQVEEL